MTVREERIAPATHVPAAPAVTSRSRAGRIALLTIGLVVALVVATLVSASVGQLGISPAEVLRTVGRSLGLPVDGPADDLVTQALWTIRFPRVVMALLIGAALAAAGVLMQAVFANPWPTPVSSGCPAARRSGPAPRSCSGCSSPGTGRRR
ncbi:iron chelate uptake ABC transporter family permease subunit [Sphingomonas sp. LR61]